jgi:hypothetical protein
MEQDGRNKMDGTRCQMEPNKWNRMDGDCDCIAEWFAFVSFVAMVCKREEIILFFFEMEGKYIHRLQISTTRKQCRIWKKNPKALVYVCVNL